MEKLSNIDGNILTILDREARAPLSKIARTLRVSREVVEYHLKKLEEKKIIKQYNTIIDASKLGYSIFRVYFKFYSITPADFQSVISLLTSSHRVFWIGETDGFTDLVFGGWFKNSKEFNAFYQPIIGRYRSVIKQEFVHEVISYSYLDRKYILPSQKKERQELTIGGNEPIKYDQIDVKILQLLSENARTPILQIAAKVGLDSSTVIYRIKQLKRKKIIVGQVLDIDLSQLSRSFYSLKIYLSNHQRKKQLNTYLRTFPFVVNFTEAIGSWDVELDIEVESHEEYHTFVNTLKEQFPDITEIVFFRAFKIYKRVNMPKLE